jgi:hypothetical protein
MTKAQEWIDYPKLRPTVMKALPVRPDIHIASSTKGKGAFMYFATDPKNKYVSCGDVHF